LELIMTVPGPSEVASRRTLGRAITDDFFRQATAFENGGRVPDWMLFAHRLGAALRGLLDALDQEGTAAPPYGSTLAPPDGGAQLCQADLLAVLRALGDGAQHAAQSRRWEDAAIYRRLARSLRDD
jgi:hypothetical protein